MEKLLLLAVLLTINTQSIAATTTLTWIGKVPSIGCTGNPMSNTIGLKKLQNQCHNDIKINKSNSRKGTLIAAFNL